MINGDSAFIIRAVAGSVRFSTRAAWLVIAAYLVVATLAGFYVVRHIAITTDSSKLLSSSLPWRQQEIKLDAEFPQRTDLITAVIDAATAEAAEEAAASLAKALEGRPELFRAVSRPDGGPFFARNGVLFLSVDEVKRNTGELVKAEPFLGTLAADPNLRGVMGALSQSVEGLSLGKTTFDNIKPAMAAISNVVEAVAAGKHPVFSWRRLISGREPTSSELRRFVLIQPVLDFGDLQPGGKATDAIRETIARLAFDPGKRREGAPDGIGAALRRGIRHRRRRRRRQRDRDGARRPHHSLARAQTGAPDRRRAGQSRHRACLDRRRRPRDGRRLEPDLRRLRRAVCRPRRRLRHPVQRALSRRTPAQRPRSQALASDRAGVAGPLLLAAASIAAAFYSFLPTAYVGLSELGLIAGTGMIIAFVTTVTLLPALIDF